MHVALEDRNSYVQEPLDADDDAAVGAVGCLDDAAVGALKTNTAHAHRRISLHGAICMNKRMKLPREKVQAKCRSQHTSDSRSARCTYI